jgi:hypothetical protein
VCRDEVVWVNDGDETAGFEDAFADGAALGAGALHGIGGEKGVDGVADFVCGCVAHHEGKARADGVEFG